MVYLVALGGVDAQWICGSSLDLPANISQAPRSDDRAKDGVA